MPGAPNPSLYFPVPESDMTCGLSKALSVITTFPDREPVAVGLNVTLIVHAEPGASVPPFAQVVPDANAKSPLMVKVDRASGTVPVPVFLSVTALAPLVVPTFCVVKLKLVALNDA